METTMQLFQYKGVVYMINKDSKKVFTYDPECPIQIGNWDTDTKTIIFIEGSMDALKTGDKDKLLSLHKKKE
jgi:hypothetical protein